MLPYPLASIVSIPCLDGTTQRMLVESIEPGPLYSVSGHSILGSLGYGSAWHNHDDLTLVSLPTEDSWKMWEDVNDDSDPNFKYGGGTEFNDDDY